MLDRGELLDWFGSGEIVVRRCRRIRPLSLLRSHIHGQDPFVRPSLFHDRNFSAGVLFISIVGLTYYASIALQPPCPRKRLDYPVVTAGLVVGPGVGVLSSMLIVGRLVGRVDTRIPVLRSASPRRFVLQRHDRLDTRGPVAQSLDRRGHDGQGTGVGFLFHTAESGGVSGRACRSRSAPKAPAFSACRHGSSAPASVFGGEQPVGPEHPGRSPPRHPVEHLRGSTRRWTIPSSRTPGIPLTAAGRAALDAVDHPASAIIAYLDDYYKLLMIATLAVIPLLMVFRGRSRGRAAAPDIERRFEATST